MTDGTSKLLQDDDFWKDMGVASNDKEVVVSNHSTVKVEGSSAPASTPVAPVASRFSPNDLPEIKPVALIPTEYQETVNRVLSIYAMLPKLEYDKLYTEIKQNLTIQSEPTPDAQSINQLLERIQAAKDRLSQILIDVIQCHNFKKRAVDVLRDTWNKFSTAKSADQRKSEADNIVVNFEIDLGYTENLYKTCDHVFKSLESLHDNVSRRITIMQVCLKYSDMGRGMLPDFSFKTFSDNLNKENQSKISVDPNDGINAEEKEFCGK